MKNGYINSNWKTSLRPASPLLAYLLLTLLPGWKAFMDQHVMRGLPAAARGELLDVGCGNGAFLKLAASAGWSVCGIDTDPAAIAVARGEGLDVQIGGIEVLTQEKEIFDWITLNHVIEHAHDPVSVLRACIRLLKPNGHLWLESPNYDSHGRAVFGEYWRGLETPRHLVLFNTQSMRDILLSLNLRNVRHADWMPQRGWMFQASKNLKCGLPPKTRSLKLLERARIEVAECISKKEVLRRESLTYICTK
ncbi:MAG: class I SAM-dependent methyltransferase [Steroidobacteraceae bacterium]